MHNPEYFYAFHSHQHLCAARKAVTSNAHLLRPTAIQLINKEAQCSNFAYRDGTIVGLCEECLWLSLRPKGISHLNQLFAQVSGNIYDSCSVRTQRSAVLSVLHTTQNHAFLLELYVLHDDIASPVLQYAKLFQPHKSMRFTFVQLYKFAQSLIILINQNYLESKIRNIVCL